MKTETLNTIKRTETQLLESIEELKKELEILHDFKTFAAAGEDDTQLIDIYLNIIEDMRDSKLDAEENNQETDYSYTERDTLFTFVKLVKNK
tara:strand:- start:1437 stop:1712 length:276 start_codon:yes stop_codon:yes gene_type:complete